jgi:hypothetical protein
MVNTSILALDAVVRWRGTPLYSLQRSGGRWYLVCKSLAVIDKLPMISLGEPPGAELSS